MSLPFVEKKIKNNKFLRIFKENTNDGELVWHRDKQDRIVEVVKSHGWFYQADNELPFLLEKGSIVEIPAGSWHRIIKGEGDLVIIVEKKKRKKVRKSYLKGTQKSNKEMRREIEKCAKEPRPASCYKDWTADKIYRKSKKAKKNPYVKAEIDLIENILNRLLIENKISDKTKKALKNKAEKHNVPLGALTAVYRKGLAAWLTGHRQGVPQHAWAMGRVNSFLSGGKTRKVDKKEWEMVKKHRSKK
jgi:hypothetical protein